MKKFLTITSLSLIALTTLTACNEDNTVKFSGDVVVTELEHTAFRPKIGKMPMQTAKYKVKTCVVAAPEQCSTNNVGSYEFQSLTVGQVLKMENNALIIPQ